MQVRARSGSVVVVTFPADDVVFAERVRELLDRQEAREMDGSLATYLAGRLKPVHPHVSTSWRDNLAGFGEHVLYVFRDGTAVSPLADDGWITADETARVVTDASGGYLDANNAAQDLFGASRDGVLQARAGSFTEPDLRIEDPEALWRALRTSGRLHSLAVVCRPDGSTRSVEFITVRDGEGPGRHVTYLRPLE